MKPMSQGEKMVWAAEFVRAHMAVEYQRGSASLAATQAVLALRASAAFNREHNEGSDEDDALQQMTGE